MHLVDIKNNIMPIIAFVLKTTLACWSNIPCNNNESVQKSKEEKIPNWTARGPAWTGLDCRNHGPLGTGAEPVQG